MPKKAKRDVPVEHLVDNIGGTKEWHHGQQLFKHGTEDLVVFANRERGSEPALKPILEVWPELLTQVLHIRIPVLLEIEHVILVHPSQFSSTDGYWQSHHHRCKSHGVRGACAWRQDTSDPTLDVTRTGNGCLLQKSLELCRARGVIQTWEGQAKRRPKLACNHEELILADLQGTGFEREFFRKRNDGTLIFDGIAWSKKMCTAIMEFPDGIGGVFEREDTERRGKIVRTPQGVGLGGLEKRSSNRHHVCANVHYAFVQPKRRRNLKIGGETLLDEITDVVDGEIRRSGPMISVEQIRVVFPPRMTAVILIFRGEPFFSVLIVHIKI